MSADLHFWFDPACPFAWMTSKWVRMVSAQRAYEVEWRLVSLRLLNSHVDYDAHFPPEYEAGHAAGLRLLRVCARARKEHGPQALAPLHLALGTRIWEQEPVDGQDVGTPILHFQPPEGVAFFGLVISRLPDEQQAVELWDHVVGLASFAGFAELKRSLRERPQLPGFGVPAARVSRTED